MTSPATPTAAYMVPRGLLPSGRALADLTFCSGIRFHGRPAACETMMNGRGSRGAVVVLRSAPRTPPYGVASRRKRQCRGRKVTRLETGADQDVRSTADRIVSETGGQLRPVHPEIGVVTRSDAVELEEVDGRVGDDEQSRRPATAPPVRGYERDETIGGGKPGVGASTRRELEAPDPPAGAVPQDHLTRGDAGEGVVGKPGEHVRNVGATNGRDGRQRPSVDDPGLVAYGTGGDEPLARGNGPQSALLRKGGAVRALPPQRDRIEPPDLVRVGLRDPDSSKNGAGNSGRPLRARAPEVARRRRATLGEHHRRGRARRGDAEDDGYVPTPVPDQS
jgi:hypothetical protein